ncbi:MAG: hypothetical protein PHZ19_10635 [Candidatus Thermoplasmatota archaeon]|nr:hypothetical protein [Candidatus Thermoplasmatota archaeon]
MSEKCYMCGRTADEVRQVMNDGIAGARLEGKRMKPENIDMDIIHKMIGRFHVHDTSAKVLVDIDAWAAFKIKICILCRAVIDNMVEAGRD